MWPRHRGRLGCCFAQFRCMQLQAAHIQPVHTFRARAEAILADAGGCVKTAKTSGQRHPELAPPNNREDDSLQALPVSEGESG